MSEQLRESLRQLASKATQGEWWIDSHGVTMMALDSLEVVFTTQCNPKTAIRHAETGNLSNWRNDWDASYIATANPANILALLSDFDTLAQRLKEAERLLAHANSFLPSTYAYALELSEKIDAFLAGKGDKP